MSEAPSGVLHPTTGLATPPSSPRKRRRFLRESEETDGEMTIERYLYAADPYRASSVANPLPYPLHMVPSADQTPLQYLSEFVSALRSAGFTEDAEIGLKDVTKPGYPQGDTPITTLRVLYLAEQRTLGSFSSARDSLRRILIAHSYPHVHVEVVHLFLCFQPSFFPTHPKDPTVVFYESTKSELLKVVNEHLGSSWRAFGLFRIGQTEEKAVPSVTVLVRPTQIHDWASLEHDMKRSIKSHFPDSLQLNVEFLPGTVGEANSVEHPGVSQISKITDDGKLGMGFSIGVSGQRGVGTAGGFVTLTQGGVTRKGILTNYHVVAPPEFAAAETKYKANSRGSSLFECDDTQSDMQYFAGKDIDATKDYVDRFIGMREKELQRFKERQEQNILIKGEPSERLQTAIPNNQVVLEDYRAKRLFLNEMPVNLGKVRVSSGALLYENKIHDWAFVELDDNTATKLFGPNPMLTLPPNHMPSVYGDFLDPSLFPAPETFGQLTEGEYYCKQGRTTGVTGGICNGVLTHCNCSGRQRARYDQFGNRVTMPVSTEEYVIFSKKMRAAEHSQDSFCEPGDFGSFLIDSSGDVCGLLYGAFTGLSGPTGSENTYVNAGLAMSMPDVMKSVALRTVPKDTGGNPSGSPAILELP